MECIMSFEASTLGRLTKTALTQNREPRHPFRVTRLPTGRELFFKPSYDLSYRRDDGLLGRS
jgi:hypothetical protein